MKFSIKEAFKSAFRVFCQNFFVVFSLSVFYVMLLIALNFVFGIFDSKCGGVVNQLAVAYYCFSLTSAFLPAFTGSEIKFRDYFHPADSKKATKEMLKFILGHFLLTLLLFIVPVLIFVIMFLIPSILLSSLFVKLFLCLLVFVAETVVLSRYCFFYIEILLGENSVLQSFKNSAKITSGNSCKIFLLLFLLLLINFVPMFWFVLIEFVRVISIIGIMGTMISIIGISFTLSLSVLIMIHVHTQLSLSKSNPLLKKTELETENNVTQAVQNKR